MKLQPADLRAQFPALRRPAVFFDGPAGSQTPECVISTIADYYRRHNANHGGVFATSRESDAAVDHARQACADFVGTRNTEGIVFGANMTTLTFALSRAIATQWSAGDRVVVTRLDHDADVSPWVRAAADRGAEVRWVNIRADDATLDLDDFDAALTGRTKLVAFTAASNAVGSRTPIAELTRKAQAVGAQVFVDAVHLAPHGLLSADEWNCDFLCCSAYKFFGPHVGVLYGKPEHLRSLPAYKVRPCPETLPDRWMTGTQNFAAVCGTGAAIEYVASIGGSEGSMRERIRRAFELIEPYETALGARLLAGLGGLRSIRVFGITDRNRLHERVPTVSFTHARMDPRAVATHLAERSIFAWHGNYYALPLTEALGQEPNGMVRVGLLHYNTDEEVDRLIDVLREID